MNSDKMNNNPETKRTTNLVYFLAMAKEEEMSNYEQKILQLEKSMAQYPLTSVHEYKYNFAKRRYDQLKKTIEDLRELEQRMESSNNYLEELKLQLLNR